MESTPSGITAILRAEHDRLEPLDRPSSHRYHKCVLRDVWRGLLVFSHGAAHDYDNKRDKLAVSDDSVEYRGLGSIHKPSDNWRIRSTQSVVSHVWLQKGHTYMRPIGDLS